MSAEQWVGAILFGLLVLVVVVLVGLLIHKLFDRRRLRQEAFRQYRQVATHRARLALLHGQLSGPVEDQATRDYLSRQAQWTMAAAYYFRATYLEQDVVKTAPPEGGFSVGDLPDLLKWFDQLESELAMDVQGTRLRPSPHP